jgi:hypothetical protein
LQNVAKGIKKGFVPVMQSTFQQRRTSLFRERQRFLQQKFGVPNAQAHQLEANVRRTGGGSPGTATIMDLEGADEEVRVLHTREMSKGSRERIQSPSKAHLVIMHDKLITDNAEKEEDIEKQTIAETGRKADPNEDPPMMILGDASKVGRLKAEAMVHLSPKSADSNILNSNHIANELKEDSANAYTGRQMHQATVVSAGHSPLNGW